MTSPRRTHRMSYAIPDPGNDFFIDQPDGMIYDTGNGRSRPLGHLAESLQAAFSQHRETGYSPSCVICQGYDIQVLVYEEIDCGPRCCISGGEVVELGTTPHSNVSDDEIPF